MLFRKVQQRYTCHLNTIYFLVLLLTNHETPLQLKNIVLSQSLPFLQLQVCDPYPFQINDKRNPLIHTNKT